MDQEIALDPVQSEEGLVINCLQDYRCQAFPLFFCCLFGQEAASAATALQCCSSASQQSSLKAAVQP